MKTPVRTRLLSALLSLVMLVSLLPVSVFAAEPASGTWEKVTEAQEDWSGQYLIVYEKGSLIMDGSLSALDKEGNKVDVTITDGKIVGDYAKYAFTIAPMTGGWSCTVRQRKVHFRQVRQQQDHHRLHSGAEYHHLR